jgi:hypothetical protein
METAPLTATGLDASFVTFTFQPWLIRVIYCALYFS